MVTFNETTPTGRRKGNWTAAHWAWIRPASFPEKADADVLAHYVDAVRQAMEDKKRLERLVEAEASKPRWKKRVNSLRCLKGVDTMRPPTSRSRPASFQGSRALGRSPHGSGSPPPSTPAGRA